MIYRFVTRLLSDKQAYYKLFELCERIKKERNDVMDKSGAKFKGLRAREVMRQLGYIIEEDTMHHDPS